ncbi:MAG TPA: phosphoribosyltransferase [Candidatus Sulfotelmatobacter sp.]|nr:phosphoribosyltransferase [Candidatus Sulfotelmatobacter sp.]
MGPIFQDRSDAGKFLAKRLKRYVEDPSLLVLALPRGGVPVGYEIARALNAPMDAFVVRKLGVPGYEELAMGAIASGGVRVLNEDVVRRLGIPDRVVEAVAAEQQEELQRREAAFRGHDKPLHIQGRKIILVDDGLATGATMRAAIRALGQHNPAAIIVAVPVGAPETCEQLRSEVDELICGQMPEPFFAIGTWYANFLQTTDDEVREFLSRAAEEYRASHRRHEQAFAD